MTKIGSMYCPRCQRQVATHRPAANHLLHLVLTVLTLGLWLVVWLWCAMNPGPQRCSVCGSTSRIHQSANVITWALMLLVLAILLVALKGTYWPG